MQRCGLDWLGRLRAIDPSTESTCSAVGCRLEPDAYVWSQSPDYCQPWRPSRVTSAFIRVRDQARLPSIRLHDLRHFAASVMLAGGVDVRTAAGRLGHAQPAVTLRTYAHVMEPADRRAAEIVGLSIAPSDNGKDPNAS